jgi:hypothetical protein
MKLQFGPLLIVSAVLSTPLAWSQAGSSDSTQSGSTDSSQQQASQGPQSAFTHPEELPPLAMLGEVTSNSFINLGLGVGTGWDSNAAGFSYTGYSRLQFIVNPSIQLRQTRPTFTWYLGGYAGYSASTSQNAYNSASPSLNAGFTYQISPRWQLHAEDTYLYTVNPFQQYLTYSTPPTYNQPNPTVYVPEATTESNSGSLDLTYKPTAHDSITFTGTESFRRYLHTTYSAYNLFSWGGVASYQHAFSAKFSAGGGYSFSALDFGHGQSRSGIQQFQAFASYQLSQHFSVSGYISPEYTATKNLVPIFCTPYGCYILVAHFNSWSNGFGGYVGWSGQRNAFRAGVSKSISDGGILLGIVQLYQANANFTRQLNSRWNLNAGMLYGDNNGHSTRMALQHLSSFTGTVGLSRQFTPAFSANLQYSYFHQNQRDIPGAIAPTWTDNNIIFMLQYTWGHSLGR